MIRKSVLCLIALPLMWACNKTNESNLPQESAGGEGRVLIQMTAEAEVADNAQLSKNGSSRYYLPNELLPDLSLASISIKGTYFDDLGKEQSYEEKFNSAEEFNTSYYDEKLEQYTPPFLKAGNYTISYNNGLDPQTESNKNACFEATTNFTVIARDDLKTVSLTAKLANSVTRLYFSSEFMDYFNGGGSFTLYTENDSELSRSYGENGDMGEEEILFCANNTDLYISGTAYRQSNDGEGDHQEYTFSKTKIGVTFQGTMRSVYMDIQGAGNGIFTIIVDDTIIGEVEENINLND